MVPITQCGGSLAWLVGGSLRSASASLHLPNSFVPILLYYYSHFYPLLHPTISFLTSVYSVKKKCAPVCVRVCVRACISRQNTKDEHICVSFSWDPNPLPLALFRVFPHLLVPVAVVRSLVRIILRFTTSRVSEPSAAQTFTVFFFSVIIYL